MGLEDDAGDKSNYPPGPWHHEPDRLEWRTGGLPCLILRSHFGSFCGYVGVYNDHPWFRGNYDRVDVHVHGGLTYSGRSRDPIMRTPQEGDRDSEIWWFGFDCAHAGDYVPGMDYLMTKLKRERPIRPMPAVLRWHDEYRDIDYVKAEVMRLAQAALEAKTLKGRVKFATDQAKQLIENARSEVRESIREAIKPSEPHPLDEMLERVRSSRRRRKMEDD